MSKKVSISFKDQEFTSYYDLFYYLTLNSLQINVSMFPRRDEYFIQNILASKFDRFFSLEEIRDIIKDKTWQHTSPQAQENLKGESDVSQ